MESVLFADGLVDVLVEELDEIEDDELEVMIEEREVEVVETDEEL